MGKRICFISGKFGDVDGVSLETDKWVHVLKEMGHTVFYCAGEFASELSNQIMLEGASFNDSVAKEILNRSFNCQTDVEQLTFDIEESSERLYLRLKAMMEANQIDTIVPQNLMAIPMQIPLSMAVKKLIERTDVLTVCHNHDFFWERERYCNCNIPELANELFPVKHHRIKHVVINSAAKRDLVRRRGIESVVVPNVMDFSEQFGQLDQYNADLKEALGVKKGDYLLIQPTRIVARKGIETALELVRKLEGIPVKLLITGYSGDEGDEYRNFLMERIEQLKIRDRVIWGDKIIRYRRGEQNGKKIYNLSDAYAIADFVTYPSTYEGFGNAFLETILAKKPFLVNNYRPVFEEDIRPCGFRGVIIENSTLTDQAVAQVKEILDNSQMTQEMVEHNFSLGDRYFSYSVLKQLIGPLFGE